MNVLVTKEGNHMTTSIYRKATHTDQYVHYESYHHLRIKSSIITCFKTRAERVCKGLNITKEKCNVFVANGYPEEMTRKSLNNQKAKAVSQTRKKTKCYPVSTIRSRTERKCGKSFERSEDQDGL